MSEERQDTGRADGWEAARRAYGRILQVFLDFTGGAPERATGEQVGLEAPTNPAAGRKTIGNRFSAPTQENSTTVIIVPNYG